MNILITGATGFIGRHLTKRLLKGKDLKVFCLVRNQKKGEKLKDLGAGLIFADIRDEASLATVKNFNIDIVFHCAAKIKDKNRFLLDETNIKGTKNICQLCLDLKVKRLIYLSTVAVVCGNDQVPYLEEMPFRANAAYGESKIEAEKIVSVYRNKGLNVVILRPPMVYGPDEPHMTKLLIFLLKHRLILIPDNGKCKLHMVYVENLVEAMIKAIDDDRFLQGSFFVVDEEALTIKETLAVMSGALGVAEPCPMPGWLKTVLSKIPFIGKKIKYLQQDIVFSTKRLLDTGFKQPYPFRSSLAESFRNFKPES